MPVTVADLQHRLAVAHDLEPGTARQIIETLFADISNALAAGHKVRVPGFGQFVIRHRGPTSKRSAHRTRDQVQGSFVPQFKPAARLKETVNASASFGDP